MNRVEAHLRKIGWLILAVVMAVAACPNLSAQDFPPAGKNQANPPSQEAPKPFPPPDKPSASDQEKQGEEVKITPRQA